MRNNSNERLASLLERKIKWRVFYYSKSYGKYFNKGRQCVQSTWWRQVDEAMERGGLAGSPRCRPGYDSLMLCSPFDCKYIPPR